METDNLRLDLNSADYLMLKQYWGKAQSADKYHLLVFHQLDVAAVAKVYLETHSAFRNAAITALGLPESVAISLVLFFVAIHDLGKFSFSFQGKVPALF